MQQLIERLARRAEPHEAADDVEAIAQEQRRAARRLLNGNDLAVCEQ